MIVGTSHEAFATPKEIKAFIRANERKSTLVERPIIGSDLMKQVVQDGKI